MSATFAAATQPARLARRLATPRTALAAAVLTLMLTVAAIPLTVADHNFQAGDGGSVVLIPAFCLIGLVVARRQPRNPIGWCLLGCALFLSIDDTASSYSVLVYRVHHGNFPLGPVAVLLQPSWAPGIVLLALSILLFPDGEFPSRGWRLPVGAFLASACVWLTGAYAIAASAIASGRVAIDSSGNLLETNHPTGGWAWWGISQDVFFGLLGVVGVAWLVGRVPAYRRAVGVRRAQLKWLLSGAATALAGGAVTIAFSGNSGILLVVGYASTVALAALPLSIGVGILRYRLYEIDRLISRTLSYTLLTGLLVGVFAGLVLLTTRVLPFSSPVGVAASTLAAAGLFSPLRNRLQRFVDRRFNRARYNTDALVAAFSAHLRDAVDPEAVEAGLVDAVARSLAPAHVSVWLRRPVATP